jgi:hypothetical protein
MGAVFGWAAVAIAHALGAEAVGLTEARDRTRIRADRPDRFGRLLADATDAGVRHAGVGRGAVRVEITAPLNWGDDALALGTADRGATGGVGTDPAHEAAAAVPALSAVAPRHTLRLSGLTGAAAATDHRLPGAGAALLGFAARIVQIQTATAPVALILGLLAIAGTAVVMVPAGVGLAATVPTRPLGRDLPALRGGGPGVVFGTMLGS